MLDKGKKNRSTKVNNKKNSRKISKKSNRVNNKKENISRKNKKIKKIVLLTISIILALVIIFSSYYLLKNPKFNITSISVVNNTKANIDNIIANSNIKLGDNVVKSFFKINKKTILNMPYIEDIKVSINFPSELVIEIIERKSIYYAYDKEKNLYYRLDENGIILELCETLSLKEDELLVNGITFDNEVVINTKINDIDYSKLVIYKNIETEVINTLIDKDITKVNFENSLTKIFLDDKIEVILPNDTNLKYNLNALKEIINNVGDVQGTIDMTKDDPTFIGI